jgi:Ser/Thr protein kinase RdoA (MazF antagonist)
MNRLLKLAKDDLGAAQDNLCRARAATRHADPTAQWGDSGQTLNEIIADYEKWQSEALEAIEQAKALERP